MHVYGMISHGELTGKVHFTVEDRVLIEIGVRDARGRLITFWPDGNIKAITLASDYHFVSETQMAEFGEAFRAIKYQFDREMKGND